MRKHFIYSLLIVFSIACSPAQHAGNASVSKSDVHEDEMAILWQQTSAEYEALCYQAFNTALLRLKSFPADMMASGSPKAIVMDLDETVLDNSAYNAQLVLNNESYSPETWRKYVAAVKSKAVPGAVEFIDEAKQLGFNVIFISNRSQETEEYTLENLKAIGVTVDESQLFLKEQGNSSKESRREMVTAQYDVVMFIGDNLADFDNMYEDEKTISQRKQITTEYMANFGNQFIILPNPVYGGWKGALNRKDASAPNNDVAKGRRAFLRID